MQRRAHEGPEGFCTEAAFCLFYIGLHLYMVLTVVAISMVLTGNVAKPRRYKQRKPMSVDPDAPLCECGKYKRQKHHGGYRIKCDRCRFSKGGSSATTQAATANSSDEETNAGP